MNTTTSTITPEQRLTVIKHLASDKGLDVVAAITHLTRDQVLDIGNRHGYPKADRLQHAAEMLEEKIRKDATDLPEHPDAHRIQQHERASIPAAPNRPAGVASTPAPAGPPTKPDEFRVLINTAKGIDTKRIQSLANRILDDVAKLRGLVDEHQDKIKAQREAEQQRAAARAEVERLEQQLAEAKSKLRPATANKPATTATSIGNGPSSKEIRNWASHNDVACPKVGRVPQSVREAYDAAHQGDAG